VAVLDNRQDALPLVLDLPDPAEDDAAVAQANFRFQCEVIARWGYNLLRPDGPIALVCEHHEDFVVLWPDGGVDPGEGARRMEPAVGCETKRSGGPWTVLRGSRGCVQRHVRGDDRTGRAGGDRECAADLFHPLAHRFKAGAGAPSAGRMAMVSDLDP
jgi:hypothetical protein